MRFPRCLPSLPCTPSSLPSARRVFLVSLKGSPVLRAGGSVSAPLSCKVSAFCSRGAGGCLPSYTALRCLTYMGRGERDERLLRAMSTNSNAIKTNGLTHSKETYCTPGDAWPVSHKAVLFFLMETSEKKTKQSPNPHTYRGNTHRANFLCIQQKSVPLMCGYLLEYEKARAHLRAAA